ncbi:kunitz-type serine protease inhibitor B6-like [Anticarsia gemmatalis]|uniref:kunitz-type serine protease inhibitor B6-like n=1 Tax=Anticarsia gemmatalis TaxID=129554 RepID=UPI003F76DD5E
MYNQHYGDWLLRTLGRRTSRHARSTDDLNENNSTEIVTELSTLSHMDHNFDKPAYCFLSQEYGNCTQYRERYLYDSYEGTCEAFFWSGCGGNQNNFESKSQCVSACIKNIRSGSIHQHSPTVPSLNNTA